MIVLDTHILVWWANQDEKLTATQVDKIRASPVLAISVISFWEIAKLTELGRLTLKMPVLNWFQDILSYPKIQLIPLSPEIIVQSTQLPGTFHKDPADQIITATAITLGCPLLTQDAKILAYPHVVTI
jgi:PIN domain nuclease of toxin-antitoxin system